MHAFGFFRPYTTDRGGVSPEPWHLSLCAGRAARAGARCRSSGCARCSRPRDIEGKEEVLAALERRTIRRYVVNVDAPPEAALLSPRLA